MGDRRGTSGLERWLRASSLRRRTSLIVDRPNGRLPPLTASGQALYAKGRSTWQWGEATDWSPISMRSRAALLAAFLP